MAVAIVNSGLGLADPGVTPGAGSNRMAYLTMFSSNSDGSSGEHAATALTYGGQSCTLIDTAKPPSPFRNGCAIAAFRLNEAGIVAMSGTTITPTWGDNDGAPDNPAFGVIVFSGVDQTTPNGTVSSFASDDTGLMTWDPGDINGVADGFVLAFAESGAPRAFTFDALTETQEVEHTDSYSAIGTLATSDTSAIDLATTYDNTQRPKLLSAMVINPAAGGVSPLVAKMLAYGKYAT